MKPFPFGILVERVDGNHPSLMRCPIIITGTPSDIGRIIRKFWHYRIWYNMQDMKGEMSKFGHDKIQDETQSAYQHFEVEDPEFARGICSVTVFYPKVLNSKVVKQLSGFPSPILIENDPVRKMARKSIPIQTKDGKEKFLPILEHSLDIETGERDTDLILVLDNPYDPAWGFRVPEDGEVFRHSVPPSLQVLDSNQATEITIWKKVRQWLRSKGSSVWEIQYPQGEYNFPDFLAFINGKEYDVEITSTPDLGNWTIKHDFRDLEKAIQKLARQPGELRHDVVQHINRKD